MTVGSHPGKRNTFHTDNAEKRFDWELVFGCHLLLSDMFVFFFCWFLFLHFFADSPILNKERSTPKTIYSSLDDNNEISINCVFEGYPVPRVRLKTMGLELNNSGISYAAGSATYKFFVKSENDFGFYNCEARNTRGSASYLIELYKSGIQIKSFHFKAQSWFMSVLLQTLRRVL